MTVKMTTAMFCSMEEVGKGQRCLGWDRLLLRRAWAWVGGRAPGCGHGMVGERGEPPRLEPSPIANPVEGSPGWMRGPLGHSADVGSRG